MLLQVEALSVTYPGGARALRGVELAVGEGECVAVVGESGSGKTTLGLAILGLLPPRARVAGSIRLAGQQLVGLAPRRHRELRGTTLGLVPQDPFAACDPLRPVRDHVHQAWRAQGRRPDPGQVDELFALVGLDPDRAGARPHQWSGGMLQRATIAAATAHRPALVIADEPTSALDAERRDEILTLLRARARSLLLISHDLTLAAAHAHTVAVCYAGRIVEQGSAADVLGAPRHPYTRALLAALPRPGRG